MCLQGLNQEKERLIVASVFSVTFSQTWQIIYLCGEIGTRSSDIR